MDRPAVWGVWALAVLTGLQFHAALLPVFVARALGSPRPLGTLVALGAGTQTLLELPSGVLADGWGCRRTLLAATLCRAAAVAWLLAWVAAAPPDTDAHPPPFAAFAVAAVLDAASDALVSGTDASLLYVATRAGPPGAFEHATAVARTAWPAAAAAATALGGLLSLRRALALSLAALGAAVAVCLALCLAEPAVAADADLKAPAGKAAAAAAAAKAGAGPSIGDVTGWRAAWRRRTAHVRATARDVVAARAAPLGALALLAVAVHAAWEAPYRLRAVFFAGTLQLPPPAAAALQSLGLAGGAVGTLFSARAVARFGARRTVAGCLAAAAAAYALSALLAAAGTAWPSLGVPPWLPGLLLAAAAVPWGLQGPARAGLLLAHAPPTARATVGSALALARSLGLAVGGPALAALAATTALPAAFAAAAAALAVLAAAVARTAWLR